MGGKNILLSSNYTLGMENPKDTGVCAYFEWDGLQLAIPCDRWMKISHNIQAIALTVEAMRGMDRWGAKNMIRAMFTGFKRLPSAGRPWHEVLEIDFKSTAAEIKTRYRFLAKAHHPDVGGDPELFKSIQAAYEQAQSLGLVS